MSLGIRIIDDMSDQDDIELRVKVQKDMVKAALKEGLKEWMDERVTEVGRWTLRGLATAGVVALAYFILAMHGWHVPPVVSK